MWQNKLKKLIEYDNSNKLYNRKCYKPFYVCT